MKNRIRLITLLVLVGLLLASVVPAAAGAVRTPVTGTLILTGLLSPAEKEWETGKNNLHQRGIGTFWYVETDDPRTTGYSITWVNAEYNYDEDGELIAGHVWGVNTIYSDEAHTLPTWECQYAGHFNAEGKRIQSACKGVGENDGLKANFTFTTPVLATTDYDLVGVILEPGG